MGKNLCVIARGRALLRYALFFTLGHIFFSFTSAWAAQGEFKDREFWVKNVKSNEMHTLTLSFSPPDLLTSQVKTEEQENSRHSESNVEQMFYELDENKGEPDETEDTVAQSLTWPEFFDYAARLADDEIEKPQKHPYFQPESSNDVILGSLAGKVFQFVSVVPADWSGNEVVVEVSFQEVQKQSDSLCSEHKSCCYGFFCPRCLAHL